MKLADGREVIEISAYAVLPRVLGHTLGNHKEGRCVAEAEPLIAPQAETEFAIWACPHRIIVQPIGEAKPGGMSDALRALTNKQVRRRIR